MCIRDRHLPAAGQLTPDGFGNNGIVIFQHIGLNGLCLLYTSVPYVIRQKIPAEGVTGFDDVVYGHIEVNNSELDDQILIKTDGKMCIRDSTGRTERRPMMS